MILLLENFDFWSSVWFCLKFVTSHLTRLVERTQWLLLSNAHPSWLKVLTHSSVQNTTGTHFRCLLRTVLVTNAAVQPRPTVRVTVTETMCEELETETATGKKDNSQVSSLFSLLIIYWKDTILYPVLNVDLQKFPADSLVRHLFCAQCFYTSVFHFQQAAIVNSNNMLIINKYTWKA